MAQRVLVAESIGDPGLQLLEVAGVDVDLGIGWTRQQLEQRIGEYDGVLIRSATKLDADLIARATKLQVIARAGVGIDNIDVGAATKRGIVVANAPRSNIVTAAEHTLALLLALARNIPQAHGSLTAGRWERNSFTGTELMDKTLGIIGFGRIGQLVAQRAKAFGMRVIAYDPYVSNERYVNLGVEKTDGRDDVYTQADFLTIHLPNTPETDGWLNAEAFANMRDGVRILNVARGSLIVDDDLRAALDSGKVAGAALDVFQREPITDHPLFHYPNVIVTPHLGASTAEATDRAGYQAAEQLVAALQGGHVTTAVNAPSIAPEDMEVLGPFVPLCRQLGRLATALALCSSIDRIEIGCHGRIAERDTRPLGTAVLLGALSGRTEEAINEVNAPSIAEERGIEVSETKSTVARDFTDLIRVTIVCGQGRTTVAGTTIGRRNRPHLLQAWGQRFNLQLEPHLTLFRYIDAPGVIGRVGMTFGEHGVNIGSAAVGHAPPDNGEQDHAVMILTTDAPVPEKLVAKIIDSSDNFVDGRTVALS
ncbi:MAG: D-3-phosphoglycerate dehydrogenase / 2-oxoglutarate reductase [Solirubrobacteraceae bacterium]|jgi:D-3-phosphoglycerate dehydrogenase|nr:D-3-phosphoglycerate dehydrogenase / 2-oxoglutarate reductase [Solirubrobacteraceae bacterium]